MRPSRPGPEVYPGGPRWALLDRLITTLDEDEVFVFGANKNGFHGAGSAGQAMRGDARNTWRDDPAFLAAKAAPQGDPARVGVWAVYGQASGPMLGHSGKSYGVVTIRRPGEKRSMPLPAILEQLEKLCAFARSRPHLRFLVTALGEQYSGYTREEIGDLWRQADLQAPLPGNLVFLRLGKDDASQT